LAETKFVETEQLLFELDNMFRIIRDGSLFQDEEYCDVPEKLRRVNDIAFSGDGEPTTYRNFDEIVQAVAELKRTHHRDDVKLVLITNASMFHRPVVQRALEILDENQGEIWAKLDAGTEKYFQTVERTKIPFRQILDNITSAASRRPIVIQSLFMAINGEPPDETEIGEFCDRLNECIAQGGRISLVQVYTIARQPAESYVAPLQNTMVDRIAETVAERTGLSTEVFYGG
jgi:wyosine [tRNA(Phe)-imidazoG37] synthetase (radical SAM superfamily)